jgi:hypothetical protein
VYQPAFYFTHSSPQNFSNNSIVDCYIAASKQQSSATIGKNQFSIGTYQMTLSMVVSVLACLRLQVEDTYCAIKSKHAMCQTISSRRSGKVCSICNCSDATLFAQKQQHNNQPNALT